MRKLSLLFEVIYKQMLPAMGSWLREPFQRIDCKPDGVGPLSFAAADFTEIGSQLSNIGFVNHTIAIDIPEAASRALS